MDINIDIFILLTGTTFAHFNRACGHTQSDVCFGTVPEQMNGHHPIQLSAISLHDVIEDGKVFVHRPEKKYAYSIKIRISMDSNLVFIYQYKLFQIYTLG